MESEDSSYSLLSQRRSEMESSYVVESGVYMSSFAATIFIAALVTIGVLLLSLLVALTVMLESCQSRNSGVFKQAGTSDQYEFCNNVAFHAELNNLEEGEYPTICKWHVLEYIKGGWFLRDLNFTLQMAETYFSTLKPDDDGLDVIVMDVDDIFLSDITYNNSSIQQRNNQLENVKHLARLLVYRLLIKLQASGWSLRLLTRNMKNRNATSENLISEGYREWSLFISRSDDELQMEDWEYISNERVQLQNQGFRIVSVISSRMDALQGPCLGKRNFKLPSPVHYKFEQQEIGL